MYTHIKFVRPSTGSTLVIKPPCGAFSERLFVDSPKAAEWQMKMFPGWIPMEFLSAEEVAEQCEEDAD